MADQRISIGDPVEVLFVHPDDGEFWRAATVVYLDDFQVGVAFADHTRMSIPRRGGGSKTWRRAHV